MLIDENNPDFYDIKNSIPKFMKLLEGKEFYFYGTFNNLFKIDDLVLEVLEDPEDGYRSSMGAVCHYPSKDDIIYQFHKKPLARVRLEYFDGNLQNDLNIDDYNEIFSGWILRDLDTDHIWLIFGTIDYDDYYPCFRFWYNPDRTQKDYVVPPKNYKSFVDRYPELYLQASQWFDGLRLELGGY